MKHAFQDMMLPEHNTQGDTQTQRLVHQPVAALARAPSQSTETPGDYSTSSMQDLAAPRYADIDRPTLSPTKTKQLNARKGQLQQKTLGLAKVPGRKARDGEVVLCGCGQTNEEGDMVQCTFCAAWQHLHCYGYIGAKDPRLPEEHTCYQCLLGDNEPRTLAMLQELALKRRVMHFLSRNKIKTQHELADSMGR